MTWSLLTLTDWHRLKLLTDSTSLETQTQIWNWLRHRPPSTTVVHHLQTVHFGLPLSQQWQNSCILSSRLMTTPYVEDMLPAIFQETARSEQHWHSDADIEGFICHKLKIINECTSCLIMPWRWALKVCSGFLNNKWNNYRSTSSSTVAGGEWIFRVWSDK